MTTYLFSKAAFSKYHKLGGLKQKCICSQFWRLQVCNQGVKRAMTSLKALEQESGPYLSLSFWCCG